MKCCYYELPISENNTNSVATHFIFCILVHRIRVYKAVSRKKIHRNLGKNIFSIENVGFDKACNKNANNKWRKSNKIKIKKQYLGHTNFGRQ